MANAATSEKKPRRWVSHGTDEEMTIMVERFKDEPIDVEIQSVYPIQMPRHVAFDYRMTRDVRDGVLELLPNENIKWENVTRKRVNVSVQSAPPKSKESSKLTRLFRRTPGPNIFMRLMMKVGLVCLIV